MKEEPILTCTGVAEAIGVSRAYISAMKASGYVCQYGTRTTRSHALKWLAAHPEFRSTGYMNRWREEKEDGAEKAPRSQRSAQPGAGGRKSGAQSRSSGPRNPSPRANPRPLAAVS